MTGKPIAVVYARGGAYGSDEANGMGFQETYMELLLGFIGFTDIRSILVEPTLAAPDDVATTESAAISEAEKIAATFLATLRVVGSDKIVPSVYSAGYYRKSQDESYVAAWDGSAAAVVLDSGYGQ